MPNRISTKVISVIESSSTNVLSKNLPTALFATGLEV